MKYSAMFIQTFKETPVDAQIISHQLLHRAGFIQKSGAGLYNYSPMMLSVIQKATNIIREELSAIGALEISLSLATPSELWKESGRWDELGELMVQFKDRLDRELCLSPTNEEAVVDYFRKIAKSYKQLPVCLFQINTKFRDEIRPRFGLMRAREFSMKDAYSFHEDHKCLDGMYQQMYDAYTRIFQRMGLHFMAVEADGGAMASSGSKTHEFHVLADTGEDCLVICDQEQWAANSEMAQTKRQQTPVIKTSNAYTKVSTADAHTISHVAQCLGVDEVQCIKTMVFVGKKEGKKTIVMACCLGDDEINLAKCSRQSGVTQLEIADDNVLHELDFIKGVLGPVAIKNKAIIVLIDSHVSKEGSYVVGANEAGVHLKDVVIDRDVAIFTHCDIRETKSDDTSLDGSPIRLGRGIEVGHIFQLGDKYTKALNATVLNHQGKAIFPLMGCYGIGVGRAVAAVVEQLSDENGIVWPESLAPFDVVILNLKPKDQAVNQASESLYQELKSQGVNVILDDRTVSAGFKFKDADLMGFPHQLIIGESFLKENTLEYRYRKSGEKALIPFEESVSFIIKKCKIKQ